MFLAQKIVPAVVCPIQTARNRASEPRIHDHASVIRILTGFTFNFIKKH